MQVKAKNKLGTCAICSRQIDPTTAIHCPICGQPYHSACWSYNHNKCAVLGCTGQTAIEGSEVQGKQNHIRILVWGITLMAVAMACAIIGLAGGIFLRGSFASPKASPIIFPSQTTALTMPYSLPATSLVQFATPTARMMIYPTDTIIPTNIPQLTEIHILKPDDFIHWYFNAVWQDRDYEYLWSLSTPSFQANASPGGYKEFTTWWGSVNRIDILSVTVINQSSTTASVTIEVTFYLNDGRILSHKKYSYNLIYSSEKQSWMFDY